MKMNAESIELRYKQAVQSHQGIMRYPAIAIQDMAWAIQEIKRLQDQVKEYEELIDWLRK